jgi:hypothetical protein
MALSCDELKRYLQQIQLTRVFAVEGHGAGLYFSETRRKSRRFAEAKYLQEGSNFNVQNANIDSSCINSGHLESRLRMPIMMKSLIKQFLPDADPVMTAPIPPKQVHIVDDSNKSLFDSVRFAIVLSGSLGAKEAEEVSIFQISSLKC